jgi:hypothetical protein
MQRAKEKEIAHLKRAAYYDSQGDTKRAMAHFSRALYFGGIKRTADHMDVDTADKQNTESSSSKRGKIDPSLVKDVQKSLRNYSTFLALRDTTTGLGAMGLGDRQQARPQAPAPAREGRASGYRSDYGR